MRVRIDGKPAYALAYLSLDAGESVLVEHGAMAMMSAGISIGIGTGAGGLMKAALRSRFGGESFFQGRYTAQVQDAWIAVAPKFPGDIAPLEMSAAHTPMLVQSGALLAHTEHINVDVRLGNVTNFEMHEGMTVLKVSGEGAALLCAYGGLVRAQLADGETYIIDTGHLVAWSAGMKTKVGPLGSLLDATLTGEGLVAEITGPGEVWCQTRAEQGLRSWLSPERGQNDGH